MTKRDVIAIDGAVGEGGGQVVRTALALSALSGREIALSNIRTGCEKSGLLRPHLALVRALAEICGAKVTGDAVGSTQLAFRPGKIRAGDYRIDVSTAGNALLVAEAVVPVLLKAEGESTVTITGGTHVPQGPTWEFFEACYLPELCRMGARVEGELERYGFFPAAGGAVKLRIAPPDVRKKVERYDLTELGAYRGGTVVGVVSALAKSIAEDEVRVIARHFPKLGLKTLVRTVKALGPGNCCYAKLDYERAPVVFSSIGTYDKSRTLVANAIVLALREFLKSGKACEKHLADQLVVPYCALAGEGRLPETLSAALALQEMTPTFTANLHLAEAIL